ncbi:Glycoside hydrolase 97 (plasmid) [Gemmatirosa kalamazoonensis]|uniref:Glycoside hydrolase 97 n=1 Tax=Gemmatirosa kalamazoonensis TaxID=861299 RepID=W0RQ87_9BACT|nr:glycoside hydrolase family 97 protein [Gemmatirosa kalamazoonensis]AHG93159.1 Glycoside hydrolase 97 [Gemmatirosa kalamazoonensis]
MRLRSIRCAASLALAAATAGAQPRTYSARSPDGETVIALAVGPQVTYTVTHRGRTLVAPSPISLTLGDGRVLGHDARPSGARTRQVSDSVRPVVAVKNAIVGERYGEVHVDFRGGYALEARAYDDGVAYRWITSLPDSVTVQSEEATFRFEGNPTAVVGLDSTFMTHQEPAWGRVPIDSIAGRKMGLLPLLVDVGAAKVAITESDLESYAGMYLASGGPGTLHGVFPQAARAEHARNDRDVDVTDRFPYLARTAGRRTFPWRVLFVADEDRELLESELVYRLAPANRLTDVSWIRPGKVAWDWWNALNVTGVPFRAGVNTDTYKYYIDFAARYHLPYIILDEGWYKLGDLMSVTPGVDVPELVRYGESKGVGVILWVVWHTLDLQMTPALDQFRRWGVKGIKVDFMQRDDQAIVDFYWRTAREAAARHLTVDFHGAHKPAGLNRAYPNVLSFEGVKGLENDKWSTLVTPTHDVTLPFTRMLAGPMDYTPGAMINAQPRQFRAVFERPMSQGTRAHQLAMYVVYESPLQMLADSPTQYLREAESMEFLEAVPTTWDETRALDGRVGEHVLVARRSGSEWYVGAMTNDRARTLALDLSFLGDGPYTLDAWEDGPNADRDGTDYRKTSRSVTRGTRVELHLAPGGGYAARIRRTGQ